MSKRWILIVILLIFALPSVLYAIGMAIEVELRTRTVGKVIFNHTKHGTHGIECSECHPKIFKRGDKRRSPVSMKQMEKGRSCGACHNGKKAFSVTGDCITCHTGAVDITFKDKNVGNIIFQHSAHLEMYSCKECHPVLFKARRGAMWTMKEMENGKSCGACHNGDTAFSVTGDCVTCHAGADDILFEDEDGGNVTFPHAAHIEMFGCRECHPDLFVAKRDANKATMEEMESGKSCGACHDGEGAFGVAEDCESCHQM
jgi:c(7)-type cytochrome triheme protein